MVGTGASPAPSREATSSHGVDRSPAGVVYEPQSLRQRNPGAMPAATPAKPTKILPQKALPALHFCAGGLSTPWPP